jgi:hypothetical protein
MPAPRRPALAFGLLVVGATLLAVALVDWTAHELVLRELLDHERRLHPHILAQGAFPWELSYWLEIADENPAGPALLTCAGLALTAVIAAIHRKSRPLLALAIAATAALPVVAAAHIASAHASLAAALFTHESGTRMRWLWPHYADHLHPWEPSLTAALAAILATLLLPCIALAALRVTRSRSTVLALALPATLATGALALLFIEYPYSSFHPSFESWVDHVAWTRYTLLAAALLLLATGRPDRRTARLLPAAALLIVGLTAVAATTSHRRAIDTLYPLRDPGAATHKFHWLPAPWSFDPPRTDACVWPDHELHSAAIQLEHDALVLDLDGVRRPLLGPATTAALRDQEWPRVHSDKPRDLLLLVDRRVSAAALVPFITALPAEVDRVLLAGAFTQNVLSADGLVETWTFCRFANLRRHTFTAADLPAGLTWGELVDDPEQRWLQRHRPAPATR